MKKGKAMKQIMLMFSLVLVATSIFGCSSKDASKKEAKSSSESKTQTYTDMAGREVTLPKEINRIISVRYMEVFMLASILGDELDDKVVSLGVSLKENENDGYKKLSETLDMDKMTDIGDVWDDKIDVEKVMELKPDIIICDTQFKEKGCVKKMIKAGLPVVFTDINSDPVYGGLNAMEMLGKMLGKESRTNEIVSYAKKQMTDLFDKINTISKTEKKKPTIYFEQGCTSPKEIGYSQGDSSGSWGLLLKKMGADNIGEGLGYVELDPEKVLSADPDIIVIGGSNWSETDDIMRMGYFQTDEKAIEHLGEYVKARKGWEDLSAVKNHRLYAIHFNAGIYPFGYTVYEALAKDIYPDELKDIDPEADLKSFFEKYMPYSYSGTFFTQWK